MGLVGEGIRDHSSIWPTEEGPHPSDIAQHSPQTSCSMRRWCSWARGGRANSLRGSCSNMVVVKREEVGHFHATSFTHMVKSVKSFLPNFCKLVAFSLCIHIHKVLSVIVTLTNLKTPLNDIDKIPIIITIQTSSNTLSCTNKKGVNGENK